MKKNGMLRAVKLRKIREYGHWKRRGDSIVLATIEGETEGKGRRGRRRMEWMDNIKHGKDEWSGLTGVPEREGQRSTEG